MMKQFRYLRDPLFMICLVVYFSNRLFIKPYYPNTFSQSYVNDLICIPFWLPIMLFVMKFIGLRRHDAPPKSYEILIPLLAWSWMFEFVAPYSDSLHGLTVADPLDILCYSAGALIGTIYWNWQLLVSAYRTLLSHRSGARARDNVHTAADTKPS